jgi:hypothetical protein
MLAYPAASCGDRGRIPSGCAILFGSYITGKPRCAEQGFNAHAIVFNYFFIDYKDKTDNGKRKKDGCCISWPLSYS